MHTIHRFEYFRSRGMSVVFQQECQHGVALGSATQAAALERPFYRLGIHLPGTATSLSRTHAQVWRALSTDSPTADADDFLAGANPLGKRIQTKAAAKPEQCLLTARFAWWLVVIGVNSQQRKKRFSYLNIFINKINKSRLCEFE